MENRLILVEGIPGSGKTTNAKKIKEKLISEGKEVMLYEEGASHPADMAWSAYLNEEEYADFLLKCLDMWETSEKIISKEELTLRIEVQARKEENHIILAYTRIDFPEACYLILVDNIATKEICDGRRSLTEFKEIHLMRWNRFAKNALLDNTIYIFECAFLQNHIFELLGVYEKNDNEIYTYLSDLLDTVKCLNPYILYIEPYDVEKIILEAAEERKSTVNTQKDWIDEMCNWVSNMNYGKSHNLTGKEGVFSFCKERLRIDKVMLEKLDMPVILIDRN